MMWIPLLHGLVWAGPVETVGFGAASMGRGAGGVALVDDVTGVFLNPAGLVRLDGPQISAGVGIFRMDFAEIPDVAWDTNRDGLVDANDPPLEISTDYGRADSLSFAIGRSIGDRFGLSFAGSLPLERFMRIRSLEPSIPTWFMYEGRPYRFDMTAGFGWEQLPGVYVGGAVEVLTQTRVDINLTVDADLRLPRDDTEGLNDLAADLSLDIHSMNLDMINSYAPTVAIFWDLGESLGVLDGWNLGATYRGASGLPVDVQVDMQANIDLEETENLEALTLAMLLPLELSFLDHYTPAMYTLGIAYESEERGRVYADGYYTDWSRATLSIAEITEGSIMAPLVGLDRPIENGNSNRIVLSNTLAFRAGGELVLPSWTGPGRFGRVQATARAGGGFQESPLESQGPDTRVLDSDRAWVTVGGGVQHHDPLGLVAGPLAWNAYLEYHFFAEGELSVQSSSEPAGVPLNGSNIPIGGRILAAGLEWSFEY